MPTAFEQTLEKTYCRIERVLPLTENPHLPSTASPRLDKCISPAGPDGQP